MRYYTRIRSRHPSHDFLRKNPELKMPKRSLIRFGSVTQNNRPGTLEINSIESIKNSKDKLRMKNCFAKANVNECNWFIFEGNLFRGQLDGDVLEVDEMVYPIVSKQRFGSRGRGNVKHDTPESLQEFLDEKGGEVENYIFENYTSFGREYRLHVSENGCFHSCRKMRRNDATERWKFNNETCVWMLPENELFNKPESWDEIVLHCQKALKEVGLDLGAFDIRVSTNGVDFKIIEVNSAPSLGEIGKAKYLAELNKLISSKM